MSDTGAIVYRFKSDTSDANGAFAQMRSQLQQLGAETKAQGQKMAGGFDQLRDSLGKLGPKFSEMSAAAKQQADGTSAAFDRIKSAAEAVTLGLAALAVAGSAYLMKVGDSAVKFGDAIRSAAGASDQTVAGMSMLKAVADRSGTALDALGTSFTEMQRKAREGDEATVKALQAIGVSAREAGSATQTELAARMADAFSRSADSSNKAAAAVALFGSSVAAKLVPELDRGSDHVRGLMEAAQRAGVVIGPQLQAQIAGTKSVFQEIGDRFQEFKMALEGIALQSFQKLKPAIDALAQMFADLVRNVTDFVEWAYQLDSANQKSVQSTSLLGEVAKKFSETIITATTYVEEMAVKVVQWADSLGVSVRGLADVFRAFGDDVRQMATRTAQALEDAFSAAITHIAAKLTGLNAVISGLQNVGATDLAKKLKDMVGDSPGEAFSKAMAPEKTFSATLSAWDKMKDGANQYKDQLNGVLERLDEQKKKQLDLLNNGGAKAPSSNEPLRSVSDPRVHAKSPDKSPAAESKDAVEKYIDSLKKANETAQAEAATWNASNAERAKAVALAQAKAAADRDGLKLTEQQKNQVSALATMTQELRDKTEQLRSLSQGFTDSIADGFDEIIMKGKSAQDVVRQLAQQMASAALKGILTGQGMFGFLGGASGSGGLLGSQMNTFSSQIMSLFSGMRAEGGPVAGGRAYVVGERGPELFMPSGGGSIIPNGAGGGVNVAVHNYGGAQIETRQTRGNDGRTQLELMVTQVFQSHMANNGAMARSLQNTFGLNRAAGKA